MPLPIRYIPYPSLLQGPEDPSTETYEFSTLGLRGHLRRSFSLYTEEIGPDRGDSLAPSAGLDTHHSVRAPPGGRTGPSGRRSHGVVAR